MKLPEISIVIPCYNHGIYIREALDSLKDLPEDLYELIIINDGSTDSYTLKVLEELKNEGYPIIHQENQGLAQTRNNLIQRATTPYILPLDSDNKIRPEYVFKSINILDNTPDVDVVYGDRMLFGDQEGHQIIGEFNLQKLMLGNYIDACAVFRKSAWQKVGGYDAQMKSGVEDWEFWLRIAFTGARFHYIPEPMFDYRVLGNSMARTTTSQNLGKIKSYMQSKHPYTLGFRIIEDHIEQRFRKNPFLFVLKLVLRAWFPSLYKKLQVSGKIQDL